MNADAEIVVKTRVDNSGLEKDLKKAEIMLNHWKNIKQEKEFANDKKGVEIADYNIDYWTKELEKAGGTIQEETELIEEQTQVIENQTEAIKEQTQAIQEQKQIQEQTPIEEIKKDLQVNEQSKSMGLISKLATNIASKFTGISVSALKIVGNLTKLGGLLGIAGIAVGALALGIKGLVNGFKQAIEKDKELEAKVKYLKFVIQNMSIATGNGISKIFTKLIDFIFNILSFFGKVIKTFTGKNIFQKTGIKDFEKSLKSSDKTAKSLQKTLAGFDEMSVLGNAGNMGGGIANSIAQNLNQLRDLAKEVEDFNFMRWFTGGYDNLWDGSKAAIEKMFNIYKEAYQSYFKPYIVDPFVEEMTKLWEQLEPHLRPVWKGMKKAWKRAIDELKPVWDELMKYIKPVWDKFVEEMWPKIKLPFELILDYLKRILAPYINKLVDFINTNFGVFGIKLNYIEIQTDEVTKAMQQDFKETGKVIKETGENIDNSISKPIDNAKDKATQTFKNIGQSVKEYVQNPVEKTKDSLNTMSTKKWDLQINTNSIKTTNGFINTLLGLLAKLTGKKWIFSIEAGGYGAYGTGSIGGRAKGGIYYPKLAIGGIVSQPGRGVLYHGASIGERGAEGVIPLTDSQQMALLGEAIGKYITINANIINSMNGRIISKEMQKIQNEQSFAINRW